MHEASFELIEIPHVRQSGKNSADIRLVVDALDLCYTKVHVDTFVIISGDSDFSPLVSKLRENNKTVIGVGVKNSTSDLLIANCDEFIYYDDLVREQRRRAPAKRGAKAASKSAAKGEGADKGARSTEPAAADPAAEAAPAAAKAAKAAKKTRGSARKTGTRSARKSAAEPVVEEAVAVAEPMPLTNGDAPVIDIDAQPVLAPGAESTREEDRRQRAIELVLETLEGLIAERGADETVWGSMVKQTLKRRQPGFNESYFGFRSFNALLEEAQARGLVALTRDDKSGGFKVRLSERVE
jgi:hypothetical protein